MNFLAHQALSGNNQSIQVGNFVADFLRGERNIEFPEQIQKGIQLHHKIDFFTDNHPSTKESILLMRPVFGKYASVLIDLYWDHFLGKHWNLYYPGDLFHFTASVYENLHNHYHFLPKRAKSMLPYMVWEDWLGHYQYDVGMTKAMKGLGRRARFENQFESKGVLFLQEHRSFLEERFLNFYPEIKLMASSY
jgi:acyl carrier protein phosphodiesterase